MAHTHHPHGHGGGHRSLWLGPGVGTVHRIGRRRFLTDLGRGAFAIAVVGGVAGVATACGGDDDPGADDVDTVSPPTETTDAPTTESAGTGETDEATNDPSGQLQWQQVGLGSVSAYVLVRGNEAAVVDTGSSGSADAIGGSLAALGVTYDDVRHVVLTHSHPDHVGSLANVLERAPTAAAYAGTLDVANITAPIDITGVGEGDDVFGLQVIDTPGHTPGSISVLDPGIGLLVVGDALTGNADGTGVSGPNERFTPDMATANDSVAKLAGLDFESVAMGHGQPVDGGAGDLVRGLADGR